MCGFNISFESVLRASMSITAAAEANSAELAGLGDVELADKAFGQANAESAEALGRGMRVFDDIVVGLERELAELAAEIEANATAYQLTERSVVSTLER